MSQPARTMSVILAALSLGLTALAASARLQDPPPDAPAAPAQTDAPADSAPPDGPPAEPPGGAPEPDPAAAQPVPPIAGPDDTAAAEPAGIELVEPAIAERLGETAQSILRQKQVTEPMWRQAGALLHAAARMSPNDPRFPRLLVEARLKVGDTTGAIEALTAYRKVDPADRIAQIQLIDLYAAQMQTADAKLEYLRDLLGRSTIPDEVRSHVAALCVPLLAERSQDEAREMVEEALKLFPQSPAALRQKYDLLPDDATPAARANVLLAMLRSNPAQPDVIAELVDLLASVGLGKEAMEWAGHAMRLFPRMGRQFPESFTANVGGQLLTSGQSPMLDEMLKAYFQARPDDPNAWFLRLMKERAAADKLDPRSVEDARAALAGRLNQVCTAVAASVGDAQPDAAPAPAAPGPTAPAPGAGPAVGAAAPTTAPATRAATPEEALAAVKRVKAGESADWEPALISTLTDLAWLELFFAEDAAAADKWVAPLRELLPPDSMTLARLNGWIDLVAGRDEQAKEKLSPFAERDALAAVGMVRLAAKDAGGQAAADEQATRLLGEYRTGLVGAMVWSALRDRGLTPPESPAAADLLAELKNFPRDWMEILNQPEAYYDVHAEVLKVAHKYREPLFAKVTIVNRTDYDLTVGTDGIIRPDLWFDARIVGLVNHPFPGAAVDRIARVVVLRGRQQTAQYVRIDQGDLHETLTRNPSASAKITISVLTNPAPVQGGIGPGPAGLRRPFTRDFVRSGFPLSQSIARKRALAAIQSGTPSEKIRNLDLLNTYIGLIGEAQQKDPSALALANDFIKTIIAARADASPAASVWATYLTATGSKEQRDEAVNALIESPGWPARLLALLAAERMPWERRTEITTALADADPDATVKAYAAASLDVMKTAPASQPAETQPAIAPAEGAADAVPKQ